MLKKRKLGLLLGGILFVQSILSFGITASPVQIEVELTNDIEQEDWGSGYTFSNTNFIEDVVDFSIESDKCEIFPENEIKTAIPPSAGPLPFLVSDNMTDVELREGTTKLTPQREIGRTSQVSITNGINSMYRISVDGGNAVIRARQENTDGEELRVYIQRRQYNESSGQISLKEQDVVTRFYENGEISFSLTGLVKDTIPSGYIEYFNFSFALKDNKGDWISNTGAQLFRDGNSLYFRKSVIMQANRSALAAITDSFTPQSRLALPKDPKFTQIFQVTDSLIAGKASDFDKIKAIHDWVAENIYYDLVSGDTDSDEDRRKYNPIQTFEDRYGVCSGISRLFMIMARYAGVPTVTIAGGSNSNWTGSPYYLESTSDKADHEWNAVFLDGIWQYVDPTWASENRYTIVDGKPTKVKGNINHVFFLPDEYSFHLNHRSDMVYTGDNSGIYGNNEKAYTTDKYPTINRTYVNSKSPVMVSDVMITPDISVLRMAQPIKQFDANVSPINAYEKNVAWSLENNSSGASISSDGLLTVAKAGKVTVVAKSTDGTEVKTRQELTILDPNQRLIEAFVTRMYINIMNRNPDAAGLKYWTDGLMNGIQTGTSISGFFLKDADELKQKNLSDEKYVEIVYVTAFGRTPDPEGLKYWTDMLNQGGTHEGIVAKMLFAGDEFANICFNNGIDRGRTLPIPNRDQNPQLTAFVARMYTEILGRAYEDDGLDYWTGFMLSSTLPMKDRISQLSRNFVFSQEFADGNHSNAEFVKRMYLIFMNRLPDVSGQNYWTGMLNNGSASRDRIFTSFLNSQEFMNIIRSYGLM